MCILIKMIQFEFLQEKLNLSCIHSPMVTELMRGIRTQIEGLISGLPSREMAAMCLGLAHRYCFPILDDFISFLKLGRYLSGILDLEIIPNTIIVINWINHLDSRWKYPCWYGFFSANITQGCELIYEEMKVATYWLAVCACLIKIASWIWEAVRVLWSEGCIPIF